MNLANIGPATKTVALGGAAVEVSGLSLRKLTQLIGAYPQLVGFLAGGKVDVTAILVEGPDMAMAIFSLGVVGPARRRFWSRRVPMVDEGMLAAFDQAAAGRQMEALASIFDLTFKGGERALPFLKMFVAPLAAVPEPDAPPPSEPSPTPSNDSSV